ncbi:integrin alpha-4-like [Anthonomus grandis grandis]|uniref:integrin alpha-4-like n=1 Tax=Anthonomus grandis grandis TaxID=2921223 RepID=UPI002165B81A|nr:integrin alpha-4-like [Anthonomus grandis grandis]
MFAIRLLVIFLSVSIIKGIFNKKNVLVLKSSDGQRFFSYSLLLQKGASRDSYSVIVGAPKNDLTNRGGDLYKCDLQSWENGLINSTDKCTRYSTSGKNVPLKRETKENAPHGNLLGINLAGDDYVNGAVVACAPRELTTRGRLVMKFYEPPFLKGHCVYIRNSSELGRSPVEIKPFQDNLVFPPSSKYLSGESYYDFAFGMAGFDLSYYSQGEIFLGAPGRRSFKGATASYSLDKQDLPTILPKRQAPTSNQDEENTYFGYSVATAKFNPKEHWFVAGAPRGNNLKGKVEIFSNEPKSTLKNHEFGSYFGASVLALDVTGDKIIDVLVGAPTSGGKTYNEGCVYFYKGINEQSFLPRITLTGSAKEGAKFGTSIVSLGDIDLDGYNDVAISAPYEDLGMGAVYIFRGDKGGLQTHSQRLSPGDLGFFHIMGFGLGMSKGNDVDGNGHNDVAIGAYKSDTLFVFKTDTIVDFNVTYDTEKTVNNSTLEFSLGVCLRYGRRSRKNVVETVDFQVKLDMDYRLTMGDVNDVFSVPVKETRCKHYRFGIRPNVINDISPLEINVDVNSKTENVVAYGQKFHSVTVPFVYGCGEDNVCNTDLSVILTSPSINGITLGLNKQLNLTVRVNNDGDPAYKCELKLMIPEGLELRGAKECVINDNFYTCLVHNRLVGAVNKYYIFDIVSLSPDVKSLTISAEITSLGDNLPGTTLDHFINIPVVLDSLPYIVGSTLPENLPLNVDVLQTSELATHQFSIGKNGPSPLPLQLNILLPVLEQDGEMVFTVVEVDSGLENMEINCSRTIEPPLITNWEIDIEEELINRAEVVTCNGHTECLKYSCTGGYLYKSGQVATFKVKVLIKPKLLVKLFNEVLKTKDIIAYVPVAYQEDPKTHLSIHSSSRLLIYINASQMVPLWICMVAVLLGVLLLILLGYGLYRCHFFDRNYKDMLEQEKVLDPNNEEEFGDEVVLRQIKTEDGVNNAYFVM